MKEYSKTINLYGISIDVDYTFYPEVKCLNRYSNGDPGYPGEEAYIEINSVKIGDLDITEMVSANPSLYDQIEEALSNPES